jgi:hypothetical protein
MHASIVYAAHIIFYFGFAAFLWSYDPKISIIFIIGGCLAGRYFVRFSAKHLGSS